jgi:hypothetical protein
LEDAAMKKNNSDQEKMSEKNTVVKNLTDASGEPSEEALVLFEKIKELVTQYTKKLDTAENISFGIITKHQIRQGMLLNFQKILVKERFGKNWIKWFSNNSDKRLLRSAKHQEKGGPAKKLLKK